MSGLGTRDSGVVKSNLPDPEPRVRIPVSVSSEFIMVKLLRAYGECLGARSR